VYVGCRLCATGAGSEWKCMINKVGCRNNYFEILLISSLPHESIFEFYDIL